MAVVFLNETIIKQQFMVGLNHRILKIIWTIYERLTLRMLIIYG